MSEFVKTPEKQEQVEVQIKADEKELFGSYATLAQITHTPEEFTLNFFYIVPNSSIGKLTASVIASPGHAKRFLKALEDNINKYEQKWGPIRVELAQPEPKIGFVH